MSEGEEVSSGDLDPLLVGILDCLVLRILAPAFFSVPPLGVPFFYIKDLF